MSKILIVDDEVKIREVIKEYAKLSGYEVLEASDGIQALNTVKEESVDLVILDIMMPNLDGFSACKQIKKIKNIPVIMLSARTEEYDKLFGFELGIDDYITKPFSPKELMARIKVVLDRYQGSTNLESSVVSFEGLTIDFSAHEVYINQEKVKITPKEFDLLAYLVKNRNIAISREKFLEDVWSYDYFGDDRTVDTHIKMLRQNLGEYRKFVVTVRGMGYKFEV